LLLQAVEGRIQGTLPDGKHIARKNLDLLGDAPAMERLLANSFENQEIQRSLEQVGRLRHLTPRSSYYYDYRHYIKDESLDSGTDYGLLV
jgi:hypothetical protein